MKPSVNRTHDGDPPKLLSTVMEIPTFEDIPALNKSSRAGPWKWVRHWMKDQLDKASQSINGYVKRSDVQLLLGVLGSPLAPGPVGRLSPIYVKENSFQPSSAQYIVHQYIAATGASKLHSSVNTMYSMGKVKMVASKFEAASKAVRILNPTKAAEGGCFILWQMMPDMWCVELSLGCSKVRAGSDGTFVWRHTPWIGSHKVKGPVRPLRRALQGLDPWITGRLFAQAGSVGEKIIHGEACFILKLVANPATLQARTDGPAETIRHVMFGYFSQKTGLLMHLEDFHLLRIQASGADTIYWETAMETSLEDYRIEDGVNIPHRGQTVSTQLRFGETTMSHIRIRLEETWVIEEVAFNVPGVTTETFIPPADLVEETALSEANELAVGAGVCARLTNECAEVAVLEKNAVDERINVLSPKYTSPENAYFGATRSQLLSRTVKSGTISGRRAVE